MSGSVAIEAPAPSGGGRRRLLGGLNGAFEGSGAAWLLTPGFVVIAALLLAPLVFVVVLGFDATNTGKSGFHTALSDPIFGRAMWRTFVLALLVATFTLVIGTLFALGMAIAPRWLAVAMLLALFTIFWTSLLVRTYGWMLLYLGKGPIYEILHALHLRSQPIAIFQTNYASYPAMVHVMLPYVVLPVFASLRQVDPAHIRAARVHGARPLTVLWRVVIPQLRAGMVSGTVLVFVMSLGFYVTPIMLGSQTSMTVSGLIGGDLHIDGMTPVSAAMSVCLLVVVVVVYAIADKFAGISEQWGGEA